MGGGDLNTKKSWHPALMSNAKRVWEAEQKTLAERKLIEQVKREREEERQMEEIAKLQEDAGGTKRLNRVSWMYQGPDAGGTAPAEEMEAFLLGKRRVDALLKADDVQQIEKAAAAPVDPVRDLTTKVALDPLLLIEKQKQEDLQKALAVRAKMQEREKRHAKDSERRKHKHHSRRDRSRDRRDSDRRRSPRRREGKDDDDSDRSRHHRRRHHSRERSTSARPSSRREYGREENRDRQHRPRHRDNGRRSESPAERSHRERRPTDRRSRSPYRKDAYRSKPPTASRSAAKGSTSDADRAARLAAMQADANELESDRNRRLEAIEQRETEERQKEDKRRGNGGNFKASLYDGVDLAGRLKGSRNLLST